MNAAQRLAVGAGLLASLLTFGATLNLVTAAEPIGTAKARGDYSNKFWGSAGGRSIRHARDYSSGYRDYARHSSAIAPALAQHEAAGVGQNIVAAQKQFTEMKKTTTAPEAVKSIDAIQKHLTAAAAAHAKMHEMCHQDSVDAAAATKCCDDVDAELKKAGDEHEKLMKHLESADASPAK